MAKCEFCDKGVTFGIKVSHSHRRSNRPWKPNVKRVKAVINGTPRHVFHFVFSAVERFHSFFFCLRRRIILFVSDGILFANSWKSEPPFGSLP